MINLCAHEENIKWKQKIFFLSFREWAHRHTHTHTHYIKILLTYTSQRSHFCLAVTEQLPLLASFQQLRQSDTRFFRFCTTSWLKRFWLLSSPRVSNGSREKCRIQRLYQTPEDSVKSINKITGSYFRSWNCSAMNTYVCWESLLHQFALVKKRFWNPLAGDYAGHCRFVVLILNKIVDEPSQFSPVNPKWLVSDVHLVSLKAKKNIQNQTGREI